MARNFARFGDIYRASLFGFDSYIVREPSYAEHILLRNWQNYAKGHAIKRVALLLGNGLMASEGEFWKEQRRMIQPAFRRDSLVGLMQTIRIANQELLRRWEAAAGMNAEVDVTGDVSRMTLDLILASIFGEDYAEAAPSFHVLSDESVRDLAFAEKFRALGAVIIRMAAQRRARGHGGRDLLGMIMQSCGRESSRTMSDQQLVKEILTLIVAGHETTASSLNWIWYLLSQHPEAEHRLWNELEAMPYDPSNPECLQGFVYTRCIIEEALRLYPPGWLLTRRAISDDVLGEYYVPRGTEVYLPIYYIQRHPSIWPDPERFDPDRFRAEGSSDARRAMLPFSAGPRNCIGESYARAEMQVHVMMIAKRLRLCYPTVSSPPALDIGVNLRSRHHFMMAPQIRSS